jgi:VCBS repeat-containing protein
MGNGDSVRIGDPGDLAIQTIQFDDGTVWDGWAIVNQMTVGTVANPNAGQTADIAYSATLANGNALPGWLTINSASGTFTGTPGNSEVGSLAVTVTATGMGGSTANTTFNLDVLSTAPIASSDMVAVTEGTGVTTIAKAGLLANDVTPVAGSTLTITGYDSATAQGNAVSVDAAGELILDIGNRYQSLGAGQTATDSFNYTVTDTAGLTSTAKVDVTIVGANDAPVAQADTAVLSEDGVVTATGNVLTNDSDVDAGTTLQVATPGTYAGQYGTLVLDANGGYTYTLDNESSSVQSLAQGATVNDVFSYAASDGITSTPSILTLAITGSNDAPVVQADAAALSEDDVVTATGNVLANDSDVDAGTTLQVATPGTYAGMYGTLVLDANGGYTYTLDNESSSVQSLAQGVTVNDVFSYAASDGITSTASILTLAITGSNDAPVVQADTAALSEDGVVTATGNVLANDSDVDAGTALQVVAPGTYAGTYGNLVLNADGSYAYTLDNSSNAVQSLAQGVTVNDVFSYAASDGITSTASILTLAITGSNDAPVVQADAAALSEDGVVTATGNVLANDSDIDAGTALQVAAPGTYAGTYGNLVLNADGSYAYTLNNNSNAVQSLGQGITVIDTFSYAATDGIVSTPSTLNLAITGSNDAPVVAVPIADQKAQTGTLFSYQVPSSSFLDIDANDTLTYAGKLSNGDPLPSWLAFDAVTRTFSGTPTSTDTGQLSLAVVATDSSGASVSDVFALTVQTVITGTDYCDFLVGGNGDEVIYGLGGSDVLIGQGGNDFLDGGSSGDLMAGGTGDDTYVVDNCGDWVIECDNAGTDTVKSSISYALSDNVEAMLLTGENDIWGADNSLNNLLVGNRAANTLLASCGNDILQGGDGNDILRDSAGNNLLSGGTGNDTLIGAIGNEFYIGAQAMTPLELVVATISSPSTVAMASTPWPAVPARTTRFHWAAEFAMPISSSASPAMT